MNRTPIVTVEGNKIVLSEEIVSISATCVDSDGLILQTRWIQTSGPKIKLDGIYSLNTGFIAPKVTSIRTISLRLDVVDNQGSSAFDFLEISVHPKSEVSLDKKEVTDKKPLEKAQAQIVTDEPESTIDLRDYLNSSLQYNVTRITNNTGEKSDEQFDSTITLNLSAHVLPIKYARISLALNPSFTTHHSSDEDQFSPAKYSILGYYSRKKIYVFSGYSYARQEASRNILVLEKVNTVTAAIGYRFKTTVNKTASSSKYGGSIEFTSTMTRMSEDGFSLIDVIRYQNSLTYTKSTNLYGTWNVRYGYLLDLPRNDSGGDYAYNGHQLTWLYDKQFAKRFRITFEVEGAYLSYSNVDSYNMFAEGEETYRTQRRAEFRAKFVYEVMKKLDIFSGLEYRQAWSNLPARYIYYNDVPVGFQDATIGSTRAIGGSLGMLFSF